MAPHDAARVGRASSSGGAGRALTIVVPAFNEALRLPRLLATLEREADGACEAAGFTLSQVIVVDDGSTDATGRLLGETQALSGRVCALRLPRNRGKGAAVRAGMLAASTDYALLSDADLSAAISELPKLARVLDAGADIAIGSRGLPTSVITRRQPAYRESLGRLYNRALRILTGLPYLDTQCGFKLFRLRAARAVFKQQRIDGFAFDAEICVLAHQRGLRVVEVPVVWAHDPDTRVGLLSGSVQMGVDLLRIGWLARRPFR